MCSSQPEAAAYHTLQWGRIKVWDNLQFGLREASGVAVNNNVSTPWDFQTGAAAGKAPAMAKQLKRIASRMPSRIVAPDCSLVCFSGSFGLIVTAPFFDAHP
jgi:hypothetical protein